MVAKEEEPPDTQDQIPVNTAVVLLGAVVLRDTEGQILAWATAEAVALLVAEVAEEGQILRRVTSRSDSLALTAKISVFAKLL